MASEEDQSDLNRLQEKVFGRESTATPEDIRQLSEMLHPQESTSQEPQTCVTDVADEPHQQTGEGATNRGASLNRAPGTGQAPRRPLARAGVVLSLACFLGGVVLGVVLGPNLVGTVASPTLQVAPLVPDVDDYITHTVHHSSALNRFDIWTATRKADSRDCLIVQDANEDRVKISCAATDVTKVWLGGYEFVSRFSQGTVSFEKQSDVFG